MSKLLKGPAKIARYSILGIVGTASVTLLTLHYRRPNTHISQFPDDFKKFTDPINKANHTAVRDYHEIRLKGYHPEINTLALTRGVFGGLFFTPQSKILQVLYKKKQHNNNFINSKDIIWDVNSTSDDDWQLGVLVSNYFKLKSWDKQDGKMLFVSEHPDMVGSIAFQAVYDKESDETVLRLANMMFNPSEDKTPVNPVVLWLHLIYAKLLLQDGSKYVKELCEDRDGLIE